MISIIEKIKGKLKISYYISISFLIFLIYVSNGAGFDELKDDTAKLEQEDIWHAGDEQIAWWRDAKFGMFVHWGPVSLTGKELSWSRMGPRPGDHKGGECIAVDVYDQLYKKFNPKEYDADVWVDIAQKAGMRYIVFTAKHHDGFSNFHTRYSDYDIEATPFKRDIVKELAKACHLKKMRLGFYYSGRDWYHPDYLTDNNDKYIDFYHGQVQELCSNYGKVDIMWFDHLGGSLDQWRPERLVRKMKKLQPDIIMNNRLVRMIDGTPTPEHLEGDFGTPEQRIGTWQVDKDWESCITLVDDQWSYKPDGKMMSLKECLHTLIKCAGSGGNLLLNVGPMANGCIEPRQIERLEQIGNWLGKYGQSIYGTRSGPFKPGDWGVSTYKGNKVYLHVIAPEIRSFKAGKIFSDITDYYLLDDVDIVVDVKQNNNQLIINFEEMPKNSIDSILVLEFRDEISFYTDIRT